MSVSTQSNSTVKTAVSKISRKFTVRRMSEFVYLEANIEAWISRVLDTVRPLDTTLAQWLRSGEVLCEIANRLVPGSIPKYSKGTNVQLKHMENISLFIRAMRTSAFGLNRFEVFETTDLFEEKVLYIITK